MLGILLQQQKHPFTLFYKPDPYNYKARISLVNSIESARMISKPDDSPFLSKSFAFIVCPLLPIKIPIVVEASPMNLYLVIES